jgi:hypothetical protein
VVEVSEQGYEPTGNAAVDEVVGSLEQLEGSPVSEHVPAFENAHEKLRGALTDATDGADTGDHTQGS